MNLNNDFEVHDESNNDVIVATSDLPVNSDNQLIDPENPEVSIIQIEPKEKKSAIDELASLDNLLKTNVSESTLFPDPGDIKYNIKHKVINYKDVEVNDDYPEISVELNGIQALEEAFIDLEYVTADINTAGGMCQSIATEADKCIPGFLNENKPISFYTKIPTATNLRYALEEIDYKKASIIAAIFTAVLAAIYKVYDWFKKRHENNKSIDKDSEAVQNDLNKMAAKYDAVDKVVDGGLATIIKEAADSKGGYSKKLIYELDELTLDILKNDSIIVKKITSVIHDNGGGRGFSIFVHNLQKALDSVSETAKKQIGSYKIVDAIQAEAQIKKMMQGIHPSGSSLLDSMKYEGKHLPIADIVYDIKNTMVSMREKKQKVTNIKSITTNLSRIVRTSLIKELGIVNEVILNQLEDLKKEVEELNKIVTSGKIETKNHISESPNYKGKKEIVDAVKYISSIVFNLTNIAKLMDDVLIREPSRCLTLLERCYDEAKAYLTSLKKEYSSDNKGNHTAELSRIEDFLEAFKAAGKKD